MSRPLIALGARPLLGCEVVVTRPKHSAGHFISELRALGAEVLEAPMIELLPPPDPERLGVRLSRLISSSEEGSLDAELLILTSVNAARVTLEALASTSGVEEGRLEEGGRALQRLVTRGLKVACVGGKTSGYVRGYGVVVSVSPARYVAEGLFEALAGEELSGARVIFPRALKAREWLVEQLTARGAQVELIPAYQTVAKPLSEATKARLMKPSANGLKRVLTFTSDSTAAAMISQWEEGSWRALFLDAQVCVIGPTVEAYLRGRGVEVDAVADPHSVEGMLEALVRLMESAAPS